MPLFFISAIFAVRRLAYWLGRLLGAGAAVAVGRDGYTNASNASAGSSFRWLGRSVWSLAILAGTYGVLASTSPRLDTLPSVVGSWLVLLILPRRTPRVFLMVARLVAMATSISALWSSWKWVTVHWPLAAAFDGLFVLCWWGMAAAMLVWSLAALRRRPGSELIPAIQRPRGMHSPPVPEGFVRAEAETSHTHLSARFEWLTRFGHANMSVQLRQEKQILSIRPSRQL